MEQYKDRKQQYFTIVSEFYSAVLGQEQYHILNIVLFNQIIK